MNAQLVKLPNGTWINPRSVIAIVPADASESYGDKIPPRVIVRYGAKSSAEHRFLNSDYATIIDCDDFDQAQRLADSLASQVNEFNV